MVDTNLNNFLPALKRIYRQSMLEQLVHKRRPLLSMFSKFEEWGGESYLPIPIIYGDPQGVSATFSNAQTNASQVRAVRFELARKNKYSIATIDGETIEATQNKTMAFLSALKAKIDGAVNALANALEIDAFRDGTGAIAQLHAATAPTVADPMVLTLKESREATCFEVGMVLTASGTAGGAARTTPATATLAKVDRTAGTLTTGFDNSGGTTNWATSDFLRRDGDTGATVNGLAAYLPTTISGSDSFQGVNRSVDSRLWGYHYDAATLGTPIDQALIAGQSLAAQDELSPNKALMHHVQWRQLVLTLGAKKEYVQMVANGAKGAVAGVGFRGVVVEGDYEPIEVYPCNKCQANTAWELKDSTWSYNTLGPMTKILDRDGLNMLRQSTADGYESRWVSRGQVGCNAPGANVRITLPSAS